MQVIEWIISQRVQKVKVRQVYPQHATGAGGLEARMRRPEPRGSETYRDTSKMLERGAVGIALSAGEYSFASEPCW